MTPDQLTALAANGESDTLEFKSSTGELREAMYALCAMLNYRGGRMLFGVTQKPAPGRTRGLGSQFAVALGRPAGQLTSYSLPFPLIPFYSLLFVIREQQMPRIRNMQTA